MARQLPSHGAGDTISSMSRHRTSVALLGALTLLLIASASLWLHLQGRRQAAPLPPPQRVTGPLQSGTVARMDSPLFRYDPAWRVTAMGADPVQPADPWNEPSGHVAFTYEGEELALKLAVGNYWGYLYATVDGLPANRLAVIPGNVNSHDELAGYKPFLAPAVQTGQEPSERWFVVHEAAFSGTHQVSLEVWRAWEQVPLRGVAVDAPQQMPYGSGFPLWPATLALVLALWNAAYGLTLWRPRPWGTRVWSRLRRTLPALEQNPPLAWLLAGCMLGAILVAFGTAHDRWLLTQLGLGLLAVVGLIRPVLWLSLLLFSLPFYLHPLPILPGRGLNLIEIGVWGGLLLFTTSRFLHASKFDRERKPAWNENGSPGIDAVSTLAFAAIVSVALVSAVASEHPGVGLREWRTLFLAAGIFSLLLPAAVLSDRGPIQGLRVLVAGWLLGGTTVALVAIWQYTSGDMVIQAEGVQRVRAFYGSPNNLALYLERTAAVTMAVALFHRQTIRRQLLTWLLLVPQLIALVLTFSKGALFLGLPTILLILALGGLFLLRGSGRSFVRLWLLAALGLAAAAALVPFLGAERFRALLNFNPETTGGLRLNLWRSSLAMALDHLWLGVGPDNFLYSYRSEYILPGAWRDPNLNHPHNFVLDWWTRLGTGGLLLAAVWFGQGVRRLWHCHDDLPPPAGHGNSQAAAVSEQSLDQDLNVLRVGALSAIGGSLAHGLIDASYALPDLLLAWILLLTLGALIAQIAARERLA